MSDTKNFDTRTKTNVKSSSHQIPLPNPNPSLKKRNRKICKSKKNPRQKLPFPPPLAAAQSHISYITFIYFTNTPTMPMVKTTVLGGKSSNVLNTFDGNIPNWTSRNRTHPLWFPSPLTGRRLLQPHVTYGGTRVSQATEIRNLRPDSNPQRRDQVRFQVSAQALWKLGNLPAASAFVH